MKWIAVLILGLAAAGCGGPTAPIETQAPPVPPLSPEVRQAALQRGQAIAAETFGILSSNLLQAIQSGGVSNALPFCSLAASPLTSGVAARHGIALRRVTHRPRNPSGRANAAESGVIQAFQAALAAGASTNPPPPLVTNLVPGQATFLAPIVLAKELCLKCHGDPATDIGLAELEVIRRLYPGDEATGFRIGELRGLWRIDFPLSSLP